MHNFSVNMDRRVRFLICLVILIYIGYCESQANENFCREQVPCDDGQCINREKWCDDETDCHDESDEKYCRTSGWLRNVNNKCTEQHFKCDNDKCVPAVTKCDGYEDCEDGSDEYGCDEKSSEAPLTNENSNSEEKLDSYTNEDFWESPAPITDEALLPGTFENPRSPVMMQVPSTTPDYYSRYRSESINQQKQSVRNQEFDYNSRPDYHQQPYPSRQNEHSQQSHYSGAHYNTHSRIPPNGQNFHQSQTFRSSPQYSGGSDTAPTASFPSNEQRPLPLVPNYRRDPLPPTTDRINFSPSILSADKDSGRLPRNPSYQSHPQTRYAARDPYNNAEIYPVSDSTTTICPHKEPKRTCRIFPQQRNSTSYPRQKIVLPSFHFQLNYTQRNGRRHKDAIQRAERWLIDQRNRFYGWGNDTARALVALSLITNSFLFNIAENNFMKKSLQAHLGMKLLAELNETNFYQTEENIVKLAQYINALLATCQDPRDVFGKDLVGGLLQVKNNELSRKRSVNPFIYITLCLANATIDENDVENLYLLLNSTSPDESVKDKQILATTALACFHHNNPDLRLDRKVEQASRNLVRRQFRDGSFGSIYSTAIAAQALISVDKGWDSRQTLDYLMRNQSEDGSFGDMLATYYILPVLSGRSLLHLRNTQCDPPPPPPPVIDKDWSPLEILNYPGTKIRVFYTVKIGNPPTTTLPTQVSVPDGISFFDILRIVQLLNPVFKFSYKEIDGKIDVYTIVGVPDDPERGYYWYLYDRGSETHQNREYTGDIRDLCPMDSEHLVYWYH